MRYVLFDIDGTLTKGGSGGRLGPRSLNLAFEDVFGRSDAFNDIQMAGKTDPIILNEAFELNGVEASDENRRAMQERYLHHLAQLVETPEGRMLVLEGADAVLETLLARNGDVTIGLLTGNWVDGARVKLTNAGLIDYFDKQAPFGSLGGFGGDGPTRDSLVPVALQRYSDVAGEDIAPNDAVIIGDTPSDVRCALVNGLRAVGVTTGPFEREELEAAGADVVLDDLTDLDAAVDVLLG